MNDIPELGGLYNICIVCKGEEEYEYFDACVVISVLFQCDEVYKQLITNGFNENNIIRLGTVTEKMQYFDLPELKQIDNEVFLDVGGYDGATTERFIEWSNGNFKKVYFFEPNENYMKLAKEKFHDEKRIMYMPYITWNKETKLGFVSAGENSCIVEDNSENGIKTIKIDQCLAGGGHSFINKNGYRRFRIASIRRCKRSNYKMEA